MNLSYQAHKILNVLNGVPVKWDDGREIVTLTLEKDDYNEWLKLLVALNDVEFGDRPQPPQQPYHRVKI